MFRRNSSRQYCVPTPNGQRENRGGHLRGTNFDEHSVLHVQHDTWSV